MVEDYHVVIGLKDCIPINHGWRAIAYHASKSDTLGEIKLTNLLPDDLGVTASYELNDFGIVD